MGVAAVTGLAMLLVTAPTLRRLPEPERSPEPEPEAKIPYRRLAQPPFVLGCTALSVAAALVAAVTMPVQVLPLWLVLATVGVLLAAIDAVTTWLPLLLTRVAWLLMGLAALVSLLFGASPSQLVRSALGAALATALYFAIWWLTRAGIEFGDVRFAPLIGAAAAAQSWPLLILALVLGTVAGGIFGLVRLLSGRRQAFPYAPSMLLGPFLAGLAQQLSGV
ncbi:hypothetical protein GCM10009841_15820 [Microlunatus panaciterrae]